MLDLYRSWYIATMLDGR